MMPKLIDLLKEIKISNGTKLRVKQTPTPVSFKGYIIYSVLDDNNHTIDQGVFKDDAFYIAGGYTTKLEQYLEQNGIPHELYDRSDNELSAKIPLDFIEIIDKPLDEIKIVNNKLKITKQKHSNLAPKTYYISDLNMFGWLEQDGFWIDVESDFDGSSKEYLDEMEIPYTIEEPEGALFIHIQPEFIEIE